MSDLNDFLPDFSRGNNGLLPAIAQCAASGQVLMLAYMNKEAWDATMKIGEVHYYSRSRAALWHKGESSGNVQKLVAARLDCDNDTILLLVEQTGGAACHLGYESCFFREYKNGAVNECCNKVFDPREVYKK